MRRQSDIQETRDKRPETLMGPRTHSRHRLALALPGARGQSVKDRRQALLSLSLSLSRSFSICLSLSAAGSDKIKPV